MERQVSVGGEVDSFCTKCKLLLGHTVMAIWAGQIRKVRCNTCMGEHSYRAAAPGSGSTRTAASRTATGRARPVAKGEPAPKVDRYAELMVGKDRSSARRYSVQERFAVGELIAHPSFGVGVVSAARGIDKVDVSFQGGVKTLLHGRGSAPAFLAKPLAPKRPDVESEADGGADAEDPTASTSDED